jgi:sigma-B regulation protein RsbU (phosphoserine phosphatase)
VTSEGRLLEETPEELFEDAPCGYLSQRLDGTIIRVNRTFEQWTGHLREELVGRLRFQELLSAGDRIYHETHVAPLLAMQGAIREIAVEIRRADGSTLPALVNQVVRADEDGRPRIIRTTIFDATDRRRYEQELMRARRREHEIAQRLQRSLLSGELPAASGLELEIFYSAAERDTEVGGDWYDCFWVVPQQTVGLVVGDVVGRGIEAAATMGQLRSAVRALAATGLSPGPLLAALDEYSRRHGVGQMSTIVLAHLTPASGEFLYACAGHPPPLIATPRAAPAYVWGGRSMPLNAFPHTLDRPEAREWLPRGAIVLLFTDGLVEDRRRPEVDGMTRLSAALAAHENESLGPLVESLIAGADARSRSDDVCMLAAALRDA